HFYIQNNYFDFNNTKCVECLPLINAALAHDSAVDTAMSGCKSCFVITELTSGVHLKALFCVLQNTKWPRNLDSPEGVVRGTARVCRRCQKTEQRARDGIRLCVLF